MRFFTFPEVHTDPVSLVEPGMSKDLTNLRPGGTYYFAQDRMPGFGADRFETEAKDLSVSFDIDPSVSKILNEHMKLASYLKESLLTIDIYDADSKFLFATSKVPMFDLLR